MLTPQEAAAKWAARTSAASSDYASGVMRVTQAPGAAAAAASSKWQARVADPSTKSKFERGSSAVSLQAWQQAASQKGASRLASGAQAAAPKFEQTMAKLLPYIATARAAVRAMPSGDLEQNIARSAAMARAMAKFQK